MFTQRRKTLANALRPFATGRGARCGGAALRAAGIDPTRRPETLQLDELARLAEFFTLGQTPSCAIVCRLRARREAILVAVPAAGQVGTVVPATPRRLASGSTRQGGAAVR